MIDAGTPNASRRAIAAAVVTGLIAFGGWLWWDHHSREVSGEMAEKAQDVLRAAGNGHSPDPQALAALKDASQPGYRAAALLTEAGVAARKGDTAKAASLYGAIAANGDIAQPYRDLATIRKVALGFDQMQPQAVIDTLKPLAVEGNPWFGSAAEMSAIAYMKMGKDNLAGPIFAQIAKQEDLPQTLRARAQQMAGALGVDTVQLDVKPTGASAAADAGKDK